MTTILKERWMRLANILKEDDLQDPVAHLKFLLGAAVHSVELAEMPNEPEAVKHHVESAYDFLADFREKQEAFAVEVPGAEEQVAELKNRISAAMEEAGLNEASMCETPVDESCGSHESMEEHRLGDDDDFVPGASAWGHSGDWEEHFDDEREAGTEMGNKTLRQLKDEGFSEEEILALLKDIV